MSKLQPMYKIELLAEWDRLVENRQVERNSQEDWNQFVDDWEENTGSPYATSARPMSKVCSDCGEHDATRGHMGCQYPQECN